MGAFSNDRGVNSDLSSSQIRLVIQNFENLELCKFIPLQHNHNYENNLILESSVLPGLYYISYNDNNKCIKIR